MSQSPAGSQLDSDVRYTDEIPAFERTLSQSPAGSQLDSDTPIDALARWEGVQMSQSPAGSQLDSDRYETFLRWRQRLSMSQSPAGSQLDSDTVMGVANTTRADNVSIPRRVSARFRPKKIVVLDKIGDYCLNPPQGLSSIPTMDVV